METNSSSNKPRSSVGNKLIFLLCLSFFSLIAGYLLSSISFVGKIGIGLFHSEYQFLKTWWKGSLLIFSAWLILWIIHVLLKKKLAESRYILVCVVSLIIALSGLYFSFYDFRHTLSHRWLGERFHLGVYLFWLGWVGILIFEYQKKKQYKITAI